MIHRELLINGVFVGGNGDPKMGTTVLTDPYNGSIVGSAPIASESYVEEAVQGAQEAFSRFKSSSLEFRRDLLEQIADRIQANREELVDLLAHEVGKPIRWGRAEVIRCEITFRLAASLCKRLGRESIDLGPDDRKNCYDVSVSRFPIGPVLAIVPYNWPLNLSAHKIAPALACGNSVVLKSSQLAPLTTLTLARLIHESGCPQGVLNAVSCEDELSRKLSQDSRFSMVSFTGSVKVGWQIRKESSARKITLELGSDCSVLMMPGCDYKAAALAVANSAYGYAGQVCISAQHLLVHKAIWPEVREAMTEATANTVSGNPVDDETVCGPVIHDDAAERIMEWIAEAEEGGASILAGGNRIGRVVEPTLLEDVPKDCRLATEEVFGPVLCMRPVDSLDEGLAFINQSKFGIHASIFSEDQRDIEQTFQELDVSGLIVNDSPTVRFDSMPYGGQKQSGVGREGVWSSMLDMSETKTLVSKHLQH